MPDFFQTYFIDPIMNSQGYNFVNTIVYAGIALALAFFVIFPYFNRKGVKFNAKFAISLLGYIMVGSSARLIEDAHFVQRTVDPLQAGFWLVTPGIYIAVGIFAILALAFSIFAEKKFKIDKLKLFGIIGFIAAIPFVTFDLLNYKQFFGLALVAVLFAVFFAIVFFLLRALKIGLLKERLNKLAFAGQLLDGVATFAAIGFFGYGEQHPVSAGILSISPILFPIVKILLILAILYYADKEIENENLRNFIKVLVMIFGFAPGFRDALTIGFSQFGGF